MQPKSGETRRAGAAAAKLSKSIRNPPTLTEAQNIQAKINELLNNLRAAGIIALEVAFLMLYCAYEHSA